MLWIYIYSLYHTGTYYSEVDNIMDESYPLGSYKIINIIHTFALMIFMKMVLKVYMKWGYLVKHITRLFIIFLIRIHDLTLFLNNDWIISLSVYDKHIYLTTSGSASFSNHTGLTAKSMNSSISFICVWVPNTPIIESKLYRARSFTSFFWISIYCCIYVCVILIPHWILSFVQWFLVHTPTSTWNTRSRNRTH